MQSEHEVAPQPNKSAHTHILRKRGRLLDKDFFYLKSGKSKRRVT